MRLLVLYLCIVLLSTLAPVQAADSGPDAIIRNMLEKEFPEFKIGAINQSHIDGLYEVVLGSDVVYVSAEGRYIIQGSMFDLELRQNLSEQSRAQARIGILNGIPAAEIIEFAPEQTEHVVYVFTDIDCGFCRRLHNDIQQLNQRGIAVRYLAFPRSGVDSKSFKNMVSVWCSEDRQLALTRAKQGKIVKLSRCENPVARHLKLGRDAGVSGTPAIFTEEGKYIGGYLNPEEMLQELQGS